MGQGVGSTGDAAAAVVGNRVGAMAVGSTRQQVTQRRRVNDVAACRSRARTQECARAWQYANVIPTASRKQPDFNTYSLCTPSGLAAVGDERVPHARRHHHIGTGGSAGGAAAAAGGQGVS